MNTPLTQLTYESYVFFAWLAQTKGPREIFTFMNTMPSVAGEDAQRQALVQSVTPEGLQKFAQDYINGFITGAHGEAVGKAPLGKAIEINQSDQKLIEAPPFTVMRGEVIFRGGEYTVKAQASDAPAPQFNRTYAPWHDIEPQVVAPCTQPVSDRFAAFPVTASKMQLTFAVTQTELYKECLPCGNLSEHQACLIGKWGISNDALQAFLGAEFKKEVNGSNVSGSAVLEFGPSGTATLQLDAFTATAAVRTEPIVISVTADGLQDGTWSSQLNRLRFCPAHDAITFTSTTTMLYPKQLTQTTTTMAGTEMREYYFECRVDGLVMSHATTRTTSGVAPTWVLGRSPMRKVSRRKKGTRFSLDMRILFRLTELSSLRDLDPGSNTDSALIE